MLRTLNDVIYLKIKVFIDIEAVILLYAIKIFLCHKMQTLSAGQYNLYSFSGCYVKHIHTHNCNRNFPLYCDRPVHILHYLLGNGILKIKKCIVDI